MKDELEVHSFIEESEPARRLAAQLGVRHRLIDLHHFPDGEVLPAVFPHWRHTVIVYQSLDHPGPKLLPLLLAADAYRRVETRRLILVAPYLCYLRQDAVFHVGQSLSRDVIGRLLGGAFDRIVTVQAHLHRTGDLSAVFGVRVDNLSVAAALADLFADDAPRVVVGPDEESLEAARTAADELHGDAIAFCKHRLGDHEIEMSLARRDDVAGKAALLLDDVCSTGATLAKAVKLLYDAGAASVDVAIAHALFDEAATARLHAAGARRIISSDAVTHPTNGLALATILADALTDEELP